MKTGYRYSFPCSTHVLGKAWLSKACVTVMLRRGQRTSSGSPKSRCSTATTRTRTPSWTPFLSAGHAEEAGAGPCPAPPGQRGSCPGDDGPSLLAGSSPQRILSAPWATWPSRAQASPATSARGRHRGGRVGRALAPLHERFLRTPAPDYPCGHTNGWHSSNLDVAGAGPAARWLCGYRLGVRNLRRLLRPGHAIERSAIGWLEPPGRRSVGTGPGTGPFARVRPSSPPEVAALPHLRRRARRVRPVRGRVVPRRRGALARQCRPGLRGLLARPPRMVRAQPARVSVAEVGPRLRLTCAPNSYGEPHRLSGVPACRSQLGSGVPPGTAACSGPPRPAQGHAKARRRQVGRRSGGVPAPPLGLMPSRASSGSCRLAQARKSTDFDFERRWWRLLFRPGRSQGRRGGPRYLRDCCWSRLRRWRYVRVCGVGSLPGQALAWPRKTR